MRRDPSGVFEIAKFRILDAVGAPIAGSKKKITVIMREKHGSSGKACIAPYLSGRKVVSKVRENSMGLP